MVETIIVSKHLHFCPSILQHSHVAFKLKWGEQHFRRSDCAHNYTISSAEIHSSFHAPVKRFYSAIKLAKTGFRTLPYCIFATCFTPLIDPSALQQPHPLGSSLTFPSFFFLSSFPLLNVYLQTAKSH